MPTAIREENLDAIIDLQINLGERIKSAYENLKKTSTDKRTKAFLKTKLRESQNNWSQFDEEHRNIFISVPANRRKTNPYLAGGLYDEVHDTHSKIEIRIETWLEEIDERNRVALAANITFPDNIQINQSTKQALKLPPIDIEPFSGDYHKWPAFKSLFVNLVHNKTEMTAVEKLHHLLHKLKGEPKRIINHYSLTSENYLDAWNAIINRYDNKRILVNTELKLLINQPTITNESASQIKELLDLTNECLNALKNLDIDISTWDPILIHILVQKIDPQSHTHWENSLVDPKSLPTLKSFLEFLETRFHCLENIVFQSAAGKQNTNKFTPYRQNNYNNNVPQYKSNSTNYNQNQRQNTVTNSNRPYQQNSNQNRFSKPQSSNQPRIENNRNSFVTGIAQGCPVCNNDHNIFNCKEFVDQSLSQRKAKIEALHLCTNCLGKHESDVCKSSKVCKECKYRHHTLLHGPKTNVNPFAASSNSMNASTSSHFVDASIKSQVLLATAVVPVVTENGNKHFLRCLLDQGSQSSFITEDASQFLKLQKTPIRVTVTGLGSLNAEKVKHLVTVNIESRYDEQFKLPIDALVLTKITGQLPSAFISTSNDWTHLNGLFLADPNYGTSNKIDILLGADVYSQIIMNGLRKGSIGSPIAQHTKLGWILSGQVWNSSQNESTCQIQSMHLRTDIDVQLRKFWEVEELPNVRMYTQEEIECENFFNETHARDEEGRFVVGLPFKKDRSQLGRSKYRALQRLAQLNLKFGKNQAYKDQYAAVIEEYMALGHMKKAPLPANNNQESYYLPHHAVIKQSSTTTKTRVVFDASAKSTFGNSLNDELLVGPTIQQDLASILLRWRTHKFILSADVTKMYRQIWIRAEDRRFHKVLWQNFDSNYVDEYELQTVTFGTAPAAYLAIKSLQQLAEYESENYPKASVIVRRDFYVDDLLTGADTEEEAITLQKDITNLLLSGRFELRKWISNDSEILKEIPESHREISFPLSFDNDNTTKTLGMHYHPAIDAFQFKVQIQSHQSAPTKRTLLSDTARLFDPLGWLAPVVIKAKIMLQRVWQAGYDWDHQLKGAIKDEWLKYKSELQNLENIRIPRWLGRESQNQQIQIHGFCDASESAYAAVVYVRVINSDGNSKITMLSSKTKVAPLQTISLPRLELCGAVLLAKLLTFAKKALQIENTEDFVWTDSEIVLAWIRGRPSQWKTFVANRVVKILEHTNVAQWKHIVSEENPADCASRGIFPCELKGHTLWWCGPPWLQKFKSDQIVTNTEFETSLEAKTKILVHHVKFDDRLEFINRFSSLTKLLRITSLLRRFSYNCRNRANKMTDPITTIEYRESMKICIKIVQQSEFCQDIHRLNSNGQCDSKSKLLALTPFIDQEGILRVGGRLKYSNLSFDQRHQIILPKDSHFAKLLIRDAHIRAEHGGAQVTMAILRNKFWVLNARNAIKNVIHKCIICHRHRKISNEQLMGSLPESRLHIDRPFCKVGVDYCGPYNLKASRLRGTRIFKGYIALFICMSTKAVHIEVVSELTTAAFMAAFDRFVGRRGLPSDVYSDNGTNFVGADRVLRRLIKPSIDRNQILSTTASKGIQWHFIPPRSPHFGGLWEAGIKSLKKHLVRIVGETALTFEELATVVVKVEAVLNSRPITPLSDDPNDLSALTPGHFLIGCELLAAPVENLSEENVNHLNKWRLINKIQQDFWKRWSSDYLNSLQPRTKWRKQNKEPKVGDLVLLKEDNLPPNKWSLARIVNLSPGGDGHVRVVTLKTQNTILKRTITKIHPLPIDYTPSSNAPPTDV